MLKYDELKHDDVNIMKDIFDTTIDVYVHNINNPIGYHDSPALERGNELTSRAIEIGIPSDYIQYVVDMAEETFRCNYESYYEQAAQEAEDRFEQMMKGANI